MSADANATIVMSSGSDTLEAAAIAPINTYGLQWDTIGILPFHAALHAFYVNGHFAARPIIYGRGRVWIDAFGTAAHQAYWLDVEKGDATPDVVPGFLDQRRQFGGGGIYCNRDTLPQVIAAANGRPFGLWLATLDGTVLPVEIFNLPHNVVPQVVQAFGAQQIGFNADLSVVVNRDYWVNRAAIIT